MSLLAWHIALGHIGLKSLKVALKSLGVTVSDMNEASVTGCSICIQAKMHRLQFTTRKHHRATKKGEIVHSNVCSFEQVSREGYRYWVTFIDDYSKETVVYPMKYKSQTFQRFKQYKATFEKDDESKILRLVSDNGGEYLSKEFEDFIHSEGIKHEPGPPHSPELNGVAERANRTLCERVRCLLFQADLLKPFWVDALRHILYTLNSIPCNTPSQQHQRPTSGILILPPSFWLFGMVQSAGGKQVKARSERQIFTAPVIHRVRRWLCPLGLATQEGDSVKGRYIS